jgi:serine-type D-Ala-D-Ala carboxypeptidase (penicillin-binding protein 5/6)
MSWIAAVILIITFPFNLLAAKSFLEKKNVASEKKSITQMEDKEGLVMGDESNEAERQKAEISQEKLAPPQPIRLESVADLSLPGAHSSLILDSDSGTILHYENGRERRQIASLTKLMTALLVMENIKDLSSPVTIDSEEVYIEGTKIGCPRSGYCISNRLKIGEQVTVENLMKAMLMNSANDAATALGKFVGGGNSDKFVDMMNERAQEMGLRDTHFCTPSGLEKDGSESECYSSAYDIARIASYDLKYDKIWEIFRLPNNLEITSCDGSYTHTLLNTDMVMDTMPNCLGAKTGFTPLAGYSLLLVAADSTGKHKIISVLLDDPYRWQDVKTMVNWAFASYKWQ